MRKSTNNIAVWCLVLLNTNFIFGQSDSLPGQAAVSIHVGMFSISRIEFGDTYHSNAGFTFGGDIRIPLSPKVNLILKSLYFTKSGTPRIKVYTYVNAELKQTGEFNDGDASYSQFNIYFGPLYHIRLTDVFEMFGTIGIAVATVHEIAHRSDNHLLIDRDAIGYGFFTGIGFERRINESNWSMFIAGDYDVVRANVDIKVLDVGGTNIATGIKKYF